MADKARAGRKKPVSQKRVAVVLASLVGTLTLSAGALLLMEGGSSALGTSRRRGGRWTGRPWLPNLPLLYHCNAGPGTILLSTNRRPFRECGESCRGSRCRRYRTHTPGTVRPKADFHFVVDNVRSRRGAVEGDVEVGLSWQNQAAGAPYAGWSDYRYHSYSAYKIAVGICFIGDLNREPITRGQQKSLTQLVRELQAQLNIPADRVLFQWELETQCRQRKSEPATVCPAIPGDSSLVLEMAIPSPINRLEPRPFNCAVSGSMDTKIHRVMVHCCLPTCVESIRQGLDAQNWPVDCEFPPRPSDA